MTKLEEQFKDAFKQCVLKENTISINPEMVASGCVDITVEECKKYSHWCLKRAGLVDEDYNEVISSAQQELFQIYLNDKQSSSAPLE